MENLNRIYKLDRSLFEQYLLYVGAIARGDFGPSFILRDFSVAELFARGLPVSMTLGALAMLFAIVSAARSAAWPPFARTAAIDYVVTGIGAFGLTIPNFVRRPGAADRVRAYPRMAAGRGLERRLAAQPRPAGHHARPAADRRGRAHDPGRDDRELALQSYPDPAVARPADPVIVGMRLRGAALPVVSYLGPAAAALLTGSVVVETIFSLPGIGRYFVEAALNRDYTLVMGTVVVVAVFVLLFNLVVDILYAVIDPRVRFD